MPRKRCPNGMRKNSRTGECEPKKMNRNNNTKANNNKKLNTIGNNTRKKSRNKCPNGMRQHPQNKKCVPKKKIKFLVKPPRDPTQIQLGKNMREEFKEKSMVYQDFKNTQQVHKRLAKTIKANNLKRTKNSLKKM